MGISPEKEQWYREFETLIEKGVELFGHADLGEMMVGWILVVNHVSFNDDSVENTNSANCFWTRPGQNPALTRGILEDFRDYFRSLQESNDDDD